ncbi:MAG TPA: hypothetical protein VH498_03200 [Candidatus Dormibacteraeota bacterium]|jgi:hypothetical protein|nr:hypothetical protein [Candidatus Dormibacteraeota bacterium]
MRRIVCAAALVLACSGCDPAPAPSSPSPSLTPTADVRLTAANAYLAALDTRNAQLDAVNADCAVATTTPSLQRCWTARQQAQQVFNAAFNAITFPADVSGDVRALMTVDARLEAAMGGLAGSAAPSADRADDGIVAAESAYFLAGTITLRKELGIAATSSPPPTP